jgi:hypothetical protein
VNADIFENFQLLDNDEIYVSTIPEPLTVVGVICLPVTYIYNLTLDLWIYLELVPGDMSDIDVLCSHRFFLGGGYFDERNT